MWTLIIFIYAGVLSSGDSVSQTTVPGFTTEVLCKQAASQLPKLVEFTKKDVRTVCVKTN